MENIKHRVRTLLTNRKFLATAFIVIGLVIVTVYSVRSYRAYRQLQYIRDQGLDRGIASIEAIEPWMTVRYVSVAYAVPEEYVFAELDIPYNQRNSHESIGHLTRIYTERPAPVPNGPREPILVRKIGEIILAYRENPVVTGLNDIRPWMTIQYIANSTGIPAEFLLSELEITAADNNVFKPLDRLARDVRFPHGPFGLIKAIEESLQRYKDQP